MGSGEMVNLVSLSLSNAHSCVSCDRDIASGGPQLRGISEATNFRVKYWLRVAQVRRVLILGSIWTDLVDLDVAKANTCPDRRRNTARDPFGQLRSHRL